MQLPEVGPIEVPDSQRRIAAHQPQPLAIAHASQSVCDAQVFVVGVVHKRWLVFQFAQKPVVGPLDDPASQTLRSLHQPQPVVVVQSSQVLEVSHALHDAAPYSQRLQVPFAGPRVLPGMQRELDSHQPQPFSLEQSPHEACVAQEAAVPVFMFEPAQSFG